MADEEAGKKPAAGEDAQRKALAAARKELAALEKKFSGGGYNMADVGRAEELRKQLAGS